MAVPILSRYILRPLLRHPMTQVLIIMAIAYALFNPSFWNTKPVAIAQWQVIDGDSLRYKTDGQSHTEIRLWGIDAVELHQTCRDKKRNVDCGQQAKQALIDILRDGELRCTLKDTDQYGRSVMQCFMHDNDIGALMVRQGWALDYRQHSQGFYRQDEQQARKNKIGIWAYQFDKPYEWRRTHKRQP
jgi:endonuclease YncB( thermonuclease family)